LRHRETGISILHDLKKQMQERHIVFDISDLPLTNPTEINIARQRLEDTLAKTDELNYAAEQHEKWKEISDYMTLLIKGGGRIEYDDDNVIEVPKDETPAYLEWTLWRAALAIDHMVNKPYEVRGFRLDSDFMFWQYEPLLQDDDRGTCEGKEEKEAFKNGKKERNGKEGKA